MNRRKKLPLILLGIFVVLLLLRVAAPFATEWYINNKLLADLGDYSGYVEDVDLALWRGAMTVHGIHIDKKMDDDEINFLDVVTVESSLSWRALTRGALRAAVYIDNPKLNFIDAEDPEDQQSGLGLDWRHLRTDIVRFTIEEVRVDDGEVRFRNFTSEPPVDIRAQDISLRATNLTNVDDEEGDRVADAVLNATLLENSELTARAGFDPFYLRTFSFATDLQLADVTQLNDFARAYANLDFKKGHGELLMELEAEDGELTGYIKPLFEELEIFDWEQDVENQEKGPLSLAWEGAASFLNALFSNNETDKIATRVEISGSIDETEVDVLSAVWGIVRNAFVKAFSAQFEGMTPFTSGEEESDGEASNSEADAENGADNQAE